MTNRKPASHTPPDPTLVWKEMKTDSGQTVFEIQAQHPVLLVFLRHFGCSFCREAMADIAKKRSQIEEGDKKIVFVHMGSPALAEPFFKKFRLLPVHHVSDPATRFYQEFGLVKGTPMQTFGLMNWIRGFEAGIVKGHGGENPTVESGLGDGFQMPGVFLLFQGKILESFIHKNPFDRPDYEKIANCCDL